MPVVPNYPQHGPQNIATPSVHVTTPLVPVSGAVGSALEAFGRQAEHVGDEVFKRAIALQNLQNETVAKEADAQYMMRAGELHADFNTRLGQNASPQAYQDYIDRLDKLRKEIRSTLPNDAARKLYDPSALSTMGRTVYNGAQHSATQMRQSADNAADARIDAFGNNIRAMPKDDVGYQRSLNGGKAEIRQKANLRGWTPEETTNAEFTLESKYLAQRIQGLADEEPFEAVKLLDENKGLMTDADFRRTEQVVLVNRNNAGARNISAQINFDLYEPTVAKRPDTSLQERIAEGRKKASQLVPNDPNFQTVVTDRITQDYNKHKSAIQDDKNRNVNTIDGALVGNYGGKIPMNLDELFATDPKVKQAYENLEPTVQRRVLNSLTVNARRGDKVDATESLRNYEILMGERQNDPAAFMDRDLYQENLSDADRKALVNQRIRMQKNADADPQVTRAIGWMRKALGADMEALSVYGRKDNNKEEYDRMTGALQSALTEWQDVHKKPATEKDVVTEIGPRLLYQRKTPGYIFGNRWPYKEKPVFNEVIPEKTLEAVKKDVTTRGGVEPSDEQVRREIMRQQFRAIFEQKKANPK